MILLDIKRKEETLQQIYRVNREDQKKRILNWTGRRFSRSGDSIFAYKVLVIVEKNC